MRRRLFSNIKSGCSNLLLPPGKLIKRDIVYDYHGNVHKGYAFDMPQSVIIRFGDLNPEFDKAVANENNWQQQYSLLLCSLYPYYLNIGDNVPYWQEKVILSCGSDNLDDDTYTSMYWIGLDKVHVYYFKGIDNYPGIYMKIDLINHAYVIYDDNNQVLYQYTPSNIAQDQLYMKPALPFVCPRYLYWENDEAPDECENLLPFPNMTIEYV